MLNFKKALFYSAMSVMVISTPANAQDANVEGRVVKLEKEMKAVQRKVFPDGAGKFFEPEIKPDEAAKTATTPSPSAVSDLIARVDSLESQLAGLTGQVEQQGNSAKAMETRLKALEAQAKTLTAAPVAVAVEAQATPVEKTPVAVVAKPATPAAKPAATTTKPAATTAAKPSASRTAAVAAVAKPSTGDGFADSYDYGYRLWEKKFYPEAQTQLEDTVKKYPKHARASFARNLLGRAYLDDGKPATAVKIFYDNYKGEPRGERAPESLFFLGDALVKLDKASEACEAFGQLVVAYPAEAKGRLAARLADGRKRGKCK
ncbi:tetratricopeptide repeat protein [Sphingorhabdus sp.]|uniref:tetratricopeptide repeat protein n=1 Tax=Sphingorhabdus sp. TaxID=1902408 RepID=UPI003BB19A2A